MPDTTIFDRVFAAVVAAEGRGALDLDPNDRGNWTSGLTGVGALKGSKFGVSAMSYPDLDIAGLTRTDVEAIYRRDYWNPVRGDDLPGPLALLAFDAAVNSGVPRAARWLQAALGVAQDGVIGEAETIPALRAAVAAGRAGSVCAEFMSRRLAFVSQADIWRRDPLGLSRRMMRMAFLSPLFETPKAS